MIVSVLSNGDKMIKPLLNQTKKIVLWIHKLVLLNIQNFLLLDWMELPFFEQGLIFHDIWFYGSTFKIASMLNLRYRPTTPLTTMFDSIRKDKAKKLLP